MSFHDNQANLSNYFLQEPFVAVFAVSSHSADLDIPMEQKLALIKQDAISKAMAMIKSGVTKIEFLARGEKGVNLDDYIDQILAAIDVLKDAYPQAQFGVGTVSSVERMERIAGNSSVDFVVTAHQPEQKIIDIAKRYGKPIVSTVSEGAELSFADGGQTVGPAKSGGEILDVARIAALREQGVEAIKVFDFGKIGQKRAGMDVSSIDKTIFALVAIGEAIRESYNGVVPSDKTFTVMTTGGIDAKTLPYIAAGVKSKVVRDKITEILGVDANEIIDILSRTAVGIGGTFTTKEYDELAKAGKLDEAAAALELTCKNVLKSIELAKTGIVSDKIEFAAHTAVVSARYFYRDPLDPNQEEILQQIKAANGVTAITTSLHSIPREQAFKAWDVVKLIRHVEFEKLADDPIKNFSPTEFGALDYLRYLNNNAQRTGLYVMNFEDSRTSDRVKYGLDGRDEDIKVEAENLRVLSACGLNSNDRPGFCYTTNFMTPFDWFRTHMDFELPDGSKAMAIQIELVAMFDRYVVNIEPEKSGYYESRYGADVMQKAEKLWNKTYREAQADFVDGRGIESFEAATQTFIRSMLKGHAGSSETTGFSLESFRQQVKDARYMGQDAATACFENDPEGKLAYETMQQNLAYYGEKLGEAQQEHNVRFVLHPDDTARSNNLYRGDLGVPRVASTAADIAYMFLNSIGTNACTGCYGSAATTVSEADVIVEAIRLIREQKPDADVSQLFPFLHLRKVIRGDESLEGFNQSPEVKAYLKEVQERLGGHHDSIAELPHHVALTPLFKTLQALHKENLLWDIRPDHSPTLPFHMDYPTGKIVESQLGQPGYDASRIMAGQQIRIMLDAMHNLEERSARDFVTHFENKLCSFGLNLDGDRQRLTYLKDLDFGKTLFEMIRQQNFAPVFNGNIAPELAQAIVAGKITEGKVVQLSEAQRVERAVA